MDVTLIVHATAGGVGIVSGYLALFSTKGAAVHRRTGMIFVYAMLVTCVFGFFLSMLRSAAPKINVPAALLTFYLIVTSLITVRRVSAASRRAGLVLTLLALAVGMADLSFGLRALATGRKVGILAVPYFLFGTVALLGVAGDVRVMRSGARTGALRLARHLWRMCFALWIAAMSFFVGQADVIPEPLRIGALLPMPGLVVLVAMFYWMWRVRRRRSLRGIQVAGVPISA